MKRTDILRMQLHLQTWVQKLENNLCFVDPFSSLFPLLFLFVWHSTLLPSSSSHSCCQIKCQTDREGRWMAHISPIEVHSMVQYVPVCALLFHSLLCSDTNLAPLVIVIKSSCTASESTKLSAYGWSSAGGWAIEGTQFCPTTLTVSNKFLFFLNGMWRSDLE